MNEPIYQPGQYVRDKRDRKYLYIVIEVGEVPKNKKPCWREYKLRTEGGEYEVSRSECVLEFADPTQAVTFGTNSGGSLFHEPVGRWRRPRSSSRKQAAQ